MEWMYNNQVVTEVPEGAIGFIYLITHVPTGKKYIGRKMLTKRITRQSKGKKKRLSVESDWRDYWSSSPDLKEEIEAQGHDKYTREILTFVNSKGALTYCEELALYLSGALERDDFYNNNIRAKIYRSWVYNKTDTTNLRSKLQSLSASSSSNTSSSPAILAPQKGQ